MGVCRALPDVAARGRRAAAVCAAGLLRYAALDRPRRGGGLLLPGDLPPWHVVYDQARRWLAAGCFEATAHDLRAVLRLAEGRAAEPSAAKVARFAPGSFGCHEALHMASVLAEMVEARLCEHPAVQMVPEWKALADRAAAALHDLYQAIGARHLGD